MTSLPSDKSSRLQIIYEICPQFLQRTSRYIEQFDRQSYHHTQGENADKSSRSSDIACLPSDSSMLLAMVSVVATLAIHLETLSYKKLSGDEAEDCRAYFFDCCVEIVVDNYCVILRSKSYLKFCFGKAFKNGLFRICGSTSQAFS